VVIEKVVRRLTLFVILAGLVASVASTPARAQDDRLDRAMKLCDTEFKGTCAASVPQWACFTLEACDKIRRLWYSRLLERLQDTPEAHELEDDRAFIEGVARDHQP
jgi:hypothetical protein